MDGEDFRLLHVSEKGVTSGSTKRGLGALMRERVLPCGRNQPSKARRRLENGRGEAGNVHFRPLFPERPCDALPLATVGKYPDRARISKDGPSRHIPCIYATIGRIEISRASKNVHFRQSHAEAENGEGVLVIGRDEALSDAGRWFKQTGIKLSR